MVDRLNVENSVLLIIDFQEKLLNAVFNKNLIEKNAIIMAKSSNILGVKTIVTEQYPKGLGKTVDTISDLLLNAKYFEKTSFSALDNAELKTILQNSEVKNVILFGIETHICVYQTAIELLKSGFNVVVVSNASGSRDENEHLTALSSLQYIGARIITTEMVLFELLKTSKHTEFKEIQNLIKGTSKN